MNHRQKNNIPLEITNQLTRPTMQIVVSVGALGIVGDRWPRALIRLIAEGKRNVTVLDGITVGVLAHIIPKSQVPIRSIAVNAHDAS
jgi:hypothetical protein